jgi:dihydrolipoamide dehydrogenase
MRKARRRTKARPVSNITTQWPRMAGWRRTPEPTRGGLVADTGTSFDVVVLGAGSGGYACALRASQLGMSVALVERDKLGGTCLHYGCIPTKALLHAGEVADAVRGSAEFGVESQLLGVDLAAANTYKDGVVASLYRGLQGLVKSRGITVIEGTGTLTAATTVSVAGSDYTGSSVVLASGSYTRTLAGVDLDGDRVLGSSDALRLKEVPRRAVVLGGGVIGVEFASAWRSLGADVTVLEALPRLVASEDAASSKALERAFRKRGVTVLTSTTFASVERTDVGVTVTAASGDRLDADVLLVAVGRGPNTADLGFEANGVTVERGFVVTDERLHTRARDVYAVGDIVAGMQLAHRGFQHGIFVAEEIAGLTPTTGPSLRRTSFTNPVVLRIWLLPFPPRL